MNRKLKHRFGLLAFALLVAGCGAPGPLGPVETIDSSAAEVAQADDDLAALAKRCRPGGRQNTPGALDPCFGEGGVVTVLGQTAGVAVQNNGRIVTAGWVRLLETGGLSDAQVVRLRASGALDSTFAGNGSVWTALSARDDAFNSVAVQRDGKIVAAGFFHNGRDFDVAVVRYLADGELDPSFGDGGVTVVAFGSASERANEVLVQPDGKIVVVANAIVAGEDVFALARLRTDGRLDASFGDGGKVVTALGGPASGIAFQRDGKLVVAGFRYIVGVGTQTSDATLARYLPDGRLDASFGTNGQVTVSLGEQYDSFSSVAVQPDGKIVAVGTASDGGPTTAFAVARFQANGALDTAFGAGGKTIVGGVFFGAFTRVALQSDGRIVAAGTSRSEENANTDVVAARFLTNGRADSTFGRGGFAVAKVGYGGQGQGLALQRDGKILVSGVSDSQTLVVVRFLP